jgi:uncharacterized hydrophobic protein (TIGR00271 family)
LLHLRAYGSPDALSGIASELEQLTGVRHVGVVGGSPDAPALLTADVRNAAADEAFRILGRHGVPPEDVVFSRLDTIGALADASEPLALVWADVVGQARTRARAPARYFTLMAASGVVGMFAVVEKNAVLLVGAMAVSPDLLPITAAATGLALRRAGLASRAFLTLAAGLAVIAVVGLLLTAVLHWAGLLPAGFTLGAIPAAQTHVNASTILVALAAGVAGMLALETRASAAVGVAISVTTVPAAAYVGVAVGLGELAKVPSALAVLGVNIVMMLIAGSCTLALQRTFAPPLR